MLSNLSGKTNILRLCIGETLNNELPDNAAKKAIIMNLIMEIPCLDTIITIYHHTAVKKRANVTLNGKILAVFR